MPNLKEIAKKDAQRQQAEEAEQADAQQAAWQEYPTLAARFVEATLGLDEGAVDPASFDAVEGREQPTWLYRRDGYQFSVLSDGVFAGEPHFSLWLMVKDESARAITRPADLVG